MKYWERLGNSFLAKLGSVKSPLSPQRKSTIEGGLADEQLSLVRREFDAAFYVREYPDVKEGGIDPVEHYLSAGWKEGRNPRPDFDTHAYLRHNIDVAISGTNPFLHYLSVGRKEGRNAGQEPGALSLDQLSLVRREFDAAFYLREYPDVKEDGIDPVEHYLSTGWKEGRNPRRDFDTYAYLRGNIDVAISGANPFLHYVSVGKKEGRKGGRPGENTFLSRVDAFEAVQNRTFPIEAEEAEKLMVIVVPEHNEMSGGIFSFFSIARAAYSMRQKHDYHVLLMTRPNRNNLTYLRQRNFRNSEDVFRLDQITRCKKARVVYLHLPEYAAPTFAHSLTDEVRHYFATREKFYVNILNQKTDIMPEKESFEDLRDLADELTQSVAHHAYFGQRFADLYNTPLLLLPAYTDLSDYEPSSFEDKEKLIIYSPDHADFRAETLEALRVGLPEYELREIRGITFDKFMDLATRCRFSITFGEGFDGYLAQPIHQGGVSFAVYNDEFFPSKKLINFGNIFASGNDMISSIVSRIRALERDVDLYRQTNNAMIRVYDELYSKEDYLKRIGNLISRKFEIYPLHQNTRDGRRR